MKKLLLSLALAIVATSSFAQDPSDALAAATTGPTLAVVETTTITPAVATVAVVGAVGGFVPALVAAVAFYSAGAGGLPGHDAPVK